MPAVSAKQKKFMDAAAHNPEFAQKAGVPVDVAKEFSKASKIKPTDKTREDLQKINKPKTDHGKSALFSKGGSMKDDMMQDKSMIKKAMGQHDTQQHGGKKTALKFKSGGSASSRADGCAVKGKTKGTMISMKSGGMSC
jgi:hypothetical protein